MENSQQRTHRQGAAAAPGTLRRRGASTAVASSKYSRSFENEEVHDTSTKKRQNKEAADAGLDRGFVRFSRGGRSKKEEPRKSRSASTSPSASATSPKRSLPRSSPAPEAVPRVTRSASPSPASSPRRRPPRPSSSALLPKYLSRRMQSMKHEAKGGGGGGGASGVSKYNIKQNEVSRLLEEEHRRFCVAYNRLLQWRFANARAMASMAAVNRVAQKQALNAWERICAMRDSTMEKRTQMQMLRHEMKVQEILKSEMGFLDEWSKLERKNVEAVGRVVRKLSAISVCLPLVDDAQADTTSVHDAMSTAMGVMEDIRAMILDINWEVEKTSALPVELSPMLTQQRQFFQEFKNWVTLVASLQVQEKSLRVHHIQLVKEGVYGIRV